MKIRHEEHHVKFEELRGGDTFTELCSDILYMKLKNGGAHNAIRLDNGSLEYIEDDIVNLVHSEVIILK